MPVKKKNGTKSMDTTLPSTSTAPGKTVDAISDESMKDMEKLRPTVERLLAAVANTTQHEQKILLVVLSAYVLHLMPKELRESLLGQLEETALNAQVIAWAKTRGVDLKEVN